MTTDLDRVDHPVVKRVGQGLTCSGGTRNASHRSISILGENDDEDFDD